MDSSPPSKSQDSRRKMRPRGARPVSAGSTSSTGSGGELPPSPLGGTVVVITVLMDQKTGYGMKVSGDKPVYVQSVRPGGSAERAGLKPGDKILKVNGHNVAQSTHIEVVELIKADAQVVLTVHQHPHHRPPTLPSSPPGLGAGTKRKGNSSRENITGPKPVDLEEKRKYESSRRLTFQLMLENEQRNIETLRSKLAVNNDPKTHDELSKAENRLRTIQGQLYALIGPVELFHNNSAPEQAPPPLPPARPRPFTLTSPIGGGSTPPALPPRNPPSSAAAPAQPCESNGLAANNHSSTPTHQRTKSSPDPIGHTASLDGASRLSTLTSSESVQDLTRREKSFSGGWDMESPRITPPGTPPPPYGGPGGDMSPQVTDLNGPVDVSMMDASYTGPIISMEDDDMSDQEMTHLEDHGPFKSVNKLLQHPAHLSVFMNYVLSSSDPSSLLFYLITDLYKEGNAKEMKKWAYEIHSTFLVPDAPLRLSHVDENNAREVDEVLFIDSDKEEILRKVFWKPRSKAKESLSEQLNDFRQKRIAGLGALFGASDIELDESIHDKSKEIAIIEGRLLPHIESLMPRIEVEVDGRSEEEVKAFQRASSICSSLCTLASKLFGLRSANSHCERVPSFVCKDKSSKLKLLARNNRKVNMLGHTLHAHHYFIVTHCNHCGRIIGGVGPQGFQCSSCLLNIHRWCVRPLEEECPGPLKKDKHNDNRISKLMERIRPEREARRKPSSLNLEKIKKSSEERDELGNMLNESDFAGGARRADLSGSSDMAEHSAAAAADAASSSGGGGITPQPLLGARKQSATSINRSESYKERVQKRQLRERRKTSDPNLGSKSANNDNADADALQFNNNSGSSSNSTHSLRSLDSPSTSMEMVTGSIAPGTETVDVWDSDIDTEPDPPDWMRFVEQEDLRKLTLREKKRQEVINELFYTERSHVRALKVLDRVFYKPLLDNQLLNLDCLVLLFPNLGEMLEIHGSLNAAMKQKRKESPIVGDISELLLNVFDGPAGERFQREAATFCAKHQLALEMLKEKRRKDQKLNNFITEAEGKAVCRRLQLKDIIPFGFQRLTKYPLLFENLVKNCEGSERAGVQRALERSKEILSLVNASVKEAADQNRLAEIQRRLDKGPFEKADHSLAAEFKNLDLTKHRLVFEGMLSWRQSKTQKPLDLHVVLLEEIIVLLVRQDEKFVLKFFSGMPAGAEKSLPYSPIIKTATVLTRPVATDKRAFFLVNMSHACAQILELVALSNSERKTWSKHITDTADASRLKNQRPRPDAATAAAPLFPPPDAPIPEDHNKDSGESSAEAASSENAEAATPSTPQEPESPSSSNPAAPATPSTPDEKLVAAASTGVVRRSSSAASSAANRDSMPRMVQESSLIQPSEVRVSQNQVHVAEPVYTPIELLRREDDAIQAAIRRKQKIVAELLHIPLEQFDTIAELAAEPGTADKEQAELALACFHQVTRLTNMLNESLRVSEEDSIAATASGLVGRQSPSLSFNHVQEITTALTSHVTQLMKMTKDREEERELIRRENMRLREQVHAMLEQRRSGASRPKRRATSTGFSRQVGLNAEESGGGGDHSEHEDEELEEGAEASPLASEECSNGAEKEDLVVEGANV